ncbi:COX15/CtaA family protein [Pontibacter sp. G13]|uniref:COX15/CtaA family protein n=1 Tax=Pontibacter sp. G13 TaxID=3074898 RepID=UPI00288958FC|nr:COX15/CtaA family protein [Pontibacter sp. G13]WNJ16606.1 COX15/CtaA family protein [Pontibacter sp. G13]
MGRFRTAAAVTVGAVIFLVLVGSVVRMTGSGMGCPDWPTCFGQIIPPTDISQLPADYKTRFAVSGREIADFDPFKTWVEYVNRLVGVAIGLLGIVTVVLSFFANKHQRGVFGWSLIGFVLILVSAGVGAYVVKTHLSEGLVTIHMLIALLVVAAFMIAFLLAWKGHVPHYSSVDGKGKQIMIGLGVLSVCMILSQVLMGTQVREQVDMLAKVTGSDSRSTWISSLNSPYQIHQLFHYALAVVMLAWGYVMRGILREQRVVWTLFVGLVALLVMEAALGIGMHRLDIPAWMQPLHLMLATMLFAGAFGLTGWLTLILKERK